MRERIPGKRVKDGMGALILALLLAFPATAAGSSVNSYRQLKAERQQEVSAEVIVRFKEGASATAERGAVKDAGAKLVERVGKDLIDAAVVRVDPGKRSAVIERLEQSGAVEYAHPNRVIQAFQTPNDSLFGEMWNLHNNGGNGGLADADIDAPEAWSYNTGSCSITVAIADTGIDTSHADLATNLWVNPGEVPGNGADDDGNGIVDDVNGVDFVRGDGVPNDEHGHGTHVAGTIGAVGFNETGTIGVSPRVRLMGLKFLDSDGFGTTDDAIAAIQYASSKGANVINASWGGGGYERALSDAIASSGIVFVAAAGNTGTNNDYMPTYPASFNLSNVISVAASNSVDGLSSFSNYGANSVDLAAPGSNITSTVPGGYASFSGTSMAAPHVSGAAALLLASKPGVPPSTIRQAMMSSVDVTGGLSRRVISSGRLNLHGALTALGGAQDTSTTLCDGTNHSKPDPSEDDLRPSKFKLISPRAGKTFYTKRARSRRITVKWSRSKDSDGIKRYLIKINGRVVKKVKDPDRKPMGRKPGTKARVRVRAGKRYARNYRIYVVAVNYKGFKRKSITTSARKGKGASRKQRAHPLGQLFRVKRKCAGKKNSSKKRCRSSA